MIESPLQSRAPDQPLLRPEVIVGAASPLWGYFSGAAMAGVAWWWMSRWMRPANLEAIAEAAVAPAAAPAAEVAVEPVAEAIADMEALAQMVEEAVAEAVVTEELAPGGEPAVLDATPAAEPVVAASVEPELTPEPPAPKVRKPRVEVEAKPD